MHKPNYSIVAKPMLGWRKLSESLAEIQWMHWKILGRVLERVLVFFFWNDLFIAGVMLTYIAKAELHRWWYSRLMQPNIPRALLSDSVTSLGPSNAELVSRPRFLITGWGTAKKRGCIWNSGLTIPPPPPHYVYFVKQILLICWW